MTLSRIACLILAFTLFPLLAIAGELTTIRILWPADHAQISAGGEHLLAYEVISGPGEHHIHVWVDDKRGPGIHKMKGAYTLPKLSRGEHVITIKTVDKEHRPTGNEQSIRLIAK